MSTPVGIDLGTTNSVVARIDEHGRPIAVPNSLGEVVTPSVICFRTGETVVGQEAKELQAAGEPFVAAFFKRQMGEANFAFYGDQRDHSATDLSALLLAKLKSDAEQTLGERIGEAVITVPAYFRNAQREATKEAGRQAGLDVPQVINEPTAAAIAYGYQRSPEPQTLLVYDLGGGTFDVSLVSVDENEIRVRTSDGDHELGGKDWDDRIVQYLATRFEQEFGRDPFEDPVSIADILVRAEAAKKRLSSVASVRISVTHDGDVGRYELDRATFESLTKDLMQRTVSLTRNVLDEQRVAIAEVGSVLLVGGSTRMPMIHSFISHTFGKDPAQGVNVDEVVAAGAAIVASSSSARGSCPTLSLPGRRRFVDVTNHSLGMIAVNAANTAYVNAIVLPKNLGVPCVETRPFQFRTRKRGENFVEVFTTQGESENPRDVSFLSMYVLRDIPYEEGGNTVLDIEYAYDVSGTVAVRGRARSSGTELRVTVESLPDDVPERFFRPPAQTVAPEHLTAYLAFDLSGSMSGEPIAEAQRAARSFVENSDLSHCSIGVIAFSDRAATKLKATQNARSIIGAVKALRVAETGYGNDTHPFDESLALLGPAKGPRFLIVLADGAWSNQEGAIAAAKRCHTQGIDVIAVGFGMADERFLKQIASSDEASFFTNLGGLVETFTTIAQVLTEAGAGAIADPRGKGGPAGGLLGFLRNR